MRLPDQPVGPVDLRRASVPSLLSLPERIDLAIIAVPPTDVPDVLEEAGALGVRATIVITAGFGETGRSASRSRPSCSRLLDGTGCGSSARIAWAW